MDAKVTKRLRILLLSQQNNPDWISVPLVGFHHSAALAHIHDVTLVTHIANEKAILSAKAPFKRVQSIDLGVFETFYNWCFAHVFRGDHGSQILTAFRIPFYWAFEWFTYRIFAAALKAGEFDVVLRLTPVAPVIPSLIAKRCRALGIPFIIGPINGGLPWPKGYSQAQRGKEWVSNLRFIYRMLPWARSTYREASAIITGSSETYHEFRAFEDRLFFMPENGIEEHRVIDRIQSPTKKGPLRLLFVGRLISIKGVDMAIRAAAELIRSERAEFTIIGDGEERAALENLAKELDVKVKFTGMLPHSEAMSYFRMSDVLIFPSIREFGGGVVFEALSTGCVPIVSNFGGPGDIIRDKRVGFAIDMHGEKYTEGAIKDILEKLDAHPELLSQMSRDGQRFAREELSWKSKALKMTAIMNWTLGLSLKPSYKAPREILD
ncbi:MAG: glycosyltransferase family 1 protein [Proteobacteria bacterium]|nr:MAG: glycosyltransferase family 1 protein [Pseudomonadota bacterium]